MPPQSQRRRRTGNHDDNGHDESIVSRRGQARRANDSAESDASEDEQDDGDNMDRSGDGAEDQLVNKLVRYALACEYARIPIKRDGIRDKGE